MKVTWCHNPGDPSDIPLGGDGVREPDERCRRRACRRISGGGRGEGALRGHLARLAKSGLDFATDVDVDAERAILATLTESRPDDRILGEESGATGSTGTRQWLVDPVCGTLNFAAQTPLVAVNVALVDGGHTPACVSADPIADEYFWSDGRSAAVRRNGRDERLTPSAVSRLIDINCDGPLDRPFLGPQLVGDLSGAPLHTGPGLVAAADAETHGMLLALIAKHL